MTKAAMVRALRRVINKLMAEEAESELYDPCPEFSRGLENRSSKHIASVLRRLGLDRGNALEALFYRE